MKKHIAFVAASVAWINYAVWLTDYLYHHHPTVLVKCNLILIAVAVLLGLIVYLAVSTVNYIDGTK